MSNTVGLPTLRFILDYQDTQRTSAGWLPCDIVVGEARYHLCASGVGGFIPFEDLASFLLAIIKDKIPAEFFWDEEGMGKNFEAWPVESDRQFRFRLVEGFPKPNSPPPLEILPPREFESNAFGYSAERPGLLIDLVMDRQEFVSTFVDALLGVIYHAPDVAQEFQIDLDVLTRLKNSLMEVER